MGFNSVREKVGADLKITNTSTSSLKTLMRKQQAFKYGVISTVAAFHHRYLQTEELRLGMSRTTASIYLPNRITPQLPDLPLPTQPALREI